jgi:phytoene dehydrogenase-like protein
MPHYDAIIVGSGPNGLASAIELARAGWSVIVYEAKPMIGGGARTMQLTLPGFKHDVCSAIHPLGVGSPFFRSLPLQTFGLEWAHPDAPLAHPLDDGTAAMLYRSFEATGETLGEDAGAYRNLLESFARNWDKLADDILGPFPFPPHHPILLTRFGIPAMLPSSVLARLWFRGRNGRTLFTGCAAHSIMSLDKLFTASFGMVLAMLGHAVGWPVPRGGSQSIVNAMAAYLETLGGKVVTDTPITHVDDLPSSRAVLFDVTPRQLVRIAGHQLPDGYKRRLQGYRYGPGVFKVDWALAGAIPWTTPECARAGTVHVGGTFEEIEHSEYEMWRGRVAEKPFVLVAQQSMVDSTRAPEGKHTGWAYCHVPNGYSEDMTERIEVQIERFAPGFRDLILARHTISPVEFEARNPNYIGGDINGGVQDVWQLFTRPVARPVPYSTPNPRLYLCSSSTPPGGGVHGMCGYHAARAVLRAFGGGLSSPPNPLSTSWRGGEVHSQR